MLKIPEVLKMSQELQLASFVFNSKSSFGNVFEKKFDWGLVEVNLDINGGLVKNCKIYSDCLIPEFILRIEKNLNNGKIEYSKNGFAGISGYKVSDIDEVCEKYLTEFCEWMQTNFE